MFKDTFSNVKEALAKLSGIVKGSLRKH